MISWVQQEHTHVWCYANKRAIQRSNKSSFTDTQKGLKRDYNFFPEGKIKQKEGCKRSQCGEKPSISNWTRSCVPTIPPYCARHSEETPFSAGRKVPQNRRANCTLPFSTRRAWCWWWYIFWRSCPKTSQQNCQFSMIQIWIHCLSIRQSFVQVSQNQLSIQYSRRVDQGSTGIIGFRPEQYTRWSLRTTARLFLHRPLIKVIT